MPRSCAGFMVPLVEYRIFIPYIEDFTPLPSLFAPGLTLNDTACLLGGWLFRIIVLLLLTQVQMLFNCGNIQNIVADQGHLGSELNADRAVKAEFMQGASLVLLNAFFFISF